MYPLKMQMVMEAECPVEAAEVLGVVVSKTLCI